MKTLNRDYRMRNNIIFGENHDGDLGFDETKDFDSLSLEQFRELVANDFIDLEDCQNDSPSAGQFLAFMEKYPAVVAHGYAVGHDRVDYRVTLEGLSFNGPVSEELSTDFSSLCRDADEFVNESNKLHAWWS